MCSLLPSSILPEGATVCSLSCAGESSSSLLFRFELEQLL